MLPKYDDCDQDENEDEDIDIDVDGVILFEDIEGFLFELDDIELQQELIMHTLDIIGIDDELIGKSMDIFSNEIFYDIIC